MKWGSCELAGLLKWISNENAEPFCAQLASADGSRARRGFTLQRWENRVGGKAKSAAGRIGQFGLPPPRRKLGLCALASTSFPRPRGSLLTTRLSGPTPAVKEQPVTLTECRTRLARRILQLRGPDPTGSIKSLFVSEAREQPARFRFTRACVSARARPKQQTWMALSSDLFEEASHLML